jgi:hypothetical protein
MGFEELEDSVEVIQKHGVMKNNFTARRIKQS